MSMLHTSGGSTEDKLYVDDVFSTYLYTGNGSTQTINNGIDLAGKGGLVWIKDRNASSISHVIQDTIRGAGTTTRLNSASTNPAGSGGLVSSFNSNGFTHNGGDTGQILTSWTFRRAPKFFDVVTYTGNGVAGRQIPHNLGCQAGMVIVKRTDGEVNWTVGHIGIGTNQLWLNTTDSTQGGQFQAPGLTSTTFTVTTGAGVNTNGATYVAYIFAHDPSADGIIQCGSFTTDGSGIATVELGWEPQFLITKAISTTSHWYMIDSMRGLTSGGPDTYLLSNLSNAESATSNYWEPTATGFTQLNMLGAGVEQIYLAIRRSNKVPTSGTEVYNAIARTGTGSATNVTGVGFAPDVLISANRRRDFVGTTSFTDRLRGTDKFIYSNTTIAEETRSAAFTFGMDGGVFGTNSVANASTASYINWFFRRAPGFFDVVCYTGTGVARTVPHNLGVAPELMIVKSRSATGGWGVWAVYHSGIVLNNILQMNTNGGYFNTVDGGYGSAWNNTIPTNTVFSVKDCNFTNYAAQTFVAYLFATLAGVSKVGSYIGNGSSQTINCGFTTGARFILIKRTDSTGDWYTWDTARGIVADNDPHLSLNSTEAEVTTDDSIDPEASGFIVNQNTATNINVLNGTYIFLAIA